MLPKGVRDAKDLDAGGDNAFRRQLAARIAALAAIEQPSAYPGEEEAARWVASRLKEVGPEAEIRSFRFNPDYWSVWGLHGLAAAAVAGLAASANRLARTASLGGGLLVAYYWGELTTEFSLRREFCPDDRRTTLWRGCRTLLLADCSLPALITTPFEPVSSSIRRSSTR